MGLPMVRDRRVTPHVTITLHVITIAFELCSSVYWAPNFGLRSTSAALLLPQPRAPLEPAMRKRHNRRHQPAVIPHCGCTLLSWKGWGWQRCVIPVA